MESYKIMNDGRVQRQSDLALIPPTKENPDYVKYLQDVKVGMEVGVFDYEAEAQRQADLEEKRLYEIAIKTKEAEILRRQAIAELEAEKVD